MPLGRSCSAPSALPASGCRWDAIGPGSLISGSVTDGSENRRGERRRRPTAGRGCRLQRAAGRALARPCGMGLRPTLPPTRCSRKRPVVRERPGVRRAPTPAPCRCRRAAGTCRAPAAPPEDAPAARAARDSQGRHSPTSVTRSALRPGGAPPGPAEGCGPRARRMGRVPVRGRCPVGQPRTRRSPPVVLQSGVNAVGAVPPAPVDNDGRPQKRRKQARHGDQARTLPARTQRRNDGLDGPGRRRPRA
jgi:hypothetical protein